MYKDYRYINAGTVEVYRFGKKAVERAEMYLTPNEAGFYSIPVDGGKYWSIGTSKGKYGEFCKINGVCFSVNSAGNAYAKADTEKGSLLVAAIGTLIEYMHKLNADRIANLEDANEDEE